MASVSTGFKANGLLRRLVLGNYVLCKYCLHRQVSIDPDNNVSLHTTVLWNGNECNICSGLMNETDSIIRRIEENLNNNYHFDTFLIGATLPVNLFEKEDQIRARFKIRGRENIKSQLTRNLREKFSQVTNKRVDLINPDLTINLDFQKDTSINVDIRMKPLNILCRYVKKKEVYRRDLDVKTTKSEAALMNHILF